MKPKIKINTIKNLTSRHRLDNRPSTDTENAILKSMRGTELMNEMGPKRVCTHIRRLYVKYWLEAFVDYLIEGNEYVFIYRQILIRLINRDTKSKKFKYNIKTRGIDTILFVKISNKLFKKNRRYYLAKVKGKFKERLDELTNKGIEFIPLKQSGYVNFKR